MHNQGQLRSRCDRTTGAIIQNVVLGFCVCCDEDHLKHSKSIVSSFRWYQGRVDEVSCMERRHHPSSNHPNIEGTRSILWSLQRSTVATLRLP